MLLRNCPFALVSENNGCFYRCRHAIVEMSSLQEFFHRTAVLIAVESLHITFNQANFIASDAL